MSVSIWDKVDLSVLETASTNTDGTSQDEPTRPQVNWRRRFRIANTVAAAVWIFGLTKVFLADIDRIFLERVAPDLIFLVDYRFFVIIGAFALAVLVVKRAFYWLLYAAIFPIVAFFWYLPRFFYRRRSWTLAFAVVSVAFKAFRKIRRKFVIRVAELIVSLIVVTSSSRPVLMCSAALIFIAILYHYGVALFGAFRPSDFLGAQRTFIRERLSADSLWSAIGISPKLRDADVVKFNKQQLDQFANSLSQGLLWVKATDFYVVLLDRYRRTAAEISLAAGSFMWLFLQSTLALTLINYAIWKIDPGQFDASSQPFFLYFAYMSLLSLYGNGASGLAPTGEWAVAISVFSAIYGPLLLIALLLQVVFGYKQARDESTFQETATEIRARKKELERRLEEEYEVPVEEALRRLSDARLGASAIIRYMAERIPAPEPPAAASDG